MKQKLIIAGIIIGVIAILFLLWTLFSDKPQPDSHVSDSIQLKADNDTLKTHLAISDKKVSDLQQSIGQQDIIIKDLYADRDAIRSQLDKTKSDAQRLADELKGKQDTTAYGRKVDSLINQVQSLIGKLNLYEQKNDSLTAANEEQVEKYQALLNERNTIFSEMRHTYDDAIQKYKVLFNDDQKREKDLRKQKLKSKIAAALALIAAGLFIAK